MSRVSRPVLAVVDDDPIFTELIRDLVEERGWEVVCHNEQEAFACIVEAKPDAVLLDLRMELGESGWMLLQTLEEQDRLRESHIVVCSGDLAQVRRREAFLREREIPILHKPFDIDDLYRALETVQRRGSDVWREPVDAAGVQ